MIDRYGDPMPDSLPRMAAAVIAGVAAVVLAACADTSVPDATPAPDTVEVNSVEELSQLCEEIGGGYPKAARYAGAGPHHIAIFAKHLVTDQVASGSGGELRFELANDTAADPQFPDVPLAKLDSPRDAELLACGVPGPGAERLNVCQYDSMISPDGRATELPLYSQRYTFTVHELRTGRVVDTLELESRMRQPAASCPTSIEGGSRVYAKAQPYEISDLVESLVTGSAR